MRPAVRPATEADADRIAPLLADLGYPSAVADVQAKLRLLGDTRDDRVFVAERDGRLIAVASVHRIPLFHATGYLARITALVVASGSRRAGTGRALVAAIEDFAWRSECVRIEVTSSDRRADAHAFYQHLGYVLDERRFLKVRDEAVPRTGDG